VDRMFPFPFYGGATTSRFLGRSDFQSDSGLCLENTQDGKEMCGTRVPVWTQHSMETLTGDSRECTELFETNCCVDEISEHSFANSFFAAEVTIDRLRQ
jgi:hypothetical protein